MERRVFVASNLIEAARGNFKGSETGSIQAEIVCGVKAILR